MRALPVLLLGLLLPACAGPGGDAPDGVPYGELGPAPDALGPSSPDVVLVVIDCLRADHVGAYGYHRETTPTIDALAGDGVLFDHVLAASNWTRPTVASLFTGLSLSQHRVPGIATPLEVTRAQTAARRDENARVLAGNALSDELYTLAEAFRDGGYATAAFINQVQMPPYLGFAQGFDRYDMVDGGDRSVVEGATAWLQEDPPGTRPRFAYLHLLRLHYPYLPAPARDLWRTRFELLPKGPFADDDRKRLAAYDPVPDDAQELMDLYDGVLRGVDRNVRRLLEGLEDIGRADDTIVVVTSDHGEAFFERGRAQHAGSSLHAELVRIPWIMRLPGGAGGGTRVSTPVGMVDIMPTLLDLAGVGVPGGLRGRSVARVVSGRELEPAALLAESSGAGADKALVWKGMKYVFDFEHDRVEVYDVQRDPADVHDLAATLPADRLHEARQVLGALLAEHERFAATVRRDQVEMDDDTVRRLRALGYVQ